MSKTDKIKDDITNTEVTRMWYKDGQGRRYSIVKYADPYGLDDRLGEMTPIYVAIEGEAPRTLGEVLNELKRYREGRADNYKLDNERLYDIERRLSTLEGAEEARSKKKWWKR